VCRIRIFMVNKIFAFLHTEIRGLHQAAFLLGAFSLFSQILALVRDKLLAFVFGASSTLDIYYASFRIPDLLFVTIGSLVSMSVLIPFIIEVKNKDKETLQKFLDNVFTFFLMLIIGVSVVVYICMPYIVPKLFPGFAQGSLDQIILTSRILLLSPILLGVSNLYGSITQSSNRFFVYAFAPLLYNMGIILGVVVLYPLFGSVGLVYGVICGAVLHVLVQIPSVIKLKMLPRFTRHLDFSLIKKVTQVSFPRTMTLSIGHISIFFLLSFASFMTTGSISIFNFAFNLQSVPLSIIGVSYSLAAFPALAKLYSKGELDTFITQFLASARHIIFWSVPCAVAFIMLRAHIVRLVLGSGQFDWNDTRLTAAALALFAFSLVFQCLALLFVRGFYATGTTEKPFYINLLSGGAVIVFTYIAMYLFDTIPTFRYFIEVMLKVPEMPGTKVLMLPLGFTLGSILNGVLMWILFARKFSGVSKPLMRTIFDSVSSSVIMGFAIFTGLRVFEQFFSLEYTTGLFAQAFLSGLCGLGVWIFILKILKNKEIDEIWKTVHGRFWKVKAISPDSQVV